MSFRFYVFDNIVAYSLHQTPSYMYHILTIFFYESKTTFLQDSLCLVRFLLENWKPQNSHVTIFNLLWVLLWCESELDVVNTFSHWLQFLADILKYKKLLTFQQLKIQAIGLKYIYLLIHSKVKVIYWIKLNSDFDSTYIAPKPHACWIWKLY